MGALRKGPGRGIRGEDDCKCSLLPLFTDWVSGQESGPDLYITSPSAGLSAAYTQPRYLVTCVHVTWRKDLAILGLLLYPQAF